jgi:hypothetical protein
MHVTMGQSTRTSKYNVTTVGTTKGAPQSCNVYTHSLSTHTLESSLDNYRSTYLHAARDRVSDKVELQAGAHKLDQGQAQGIPHCRRQHDTGAAAAKL